MTYVRGSNPIWSYVDLTGHQFDDTYYMFVLQNVLPYLPAKVYHEPDGIPWINPIRFLANGTLPNDIYFDPGNDTEPNVYRLEFRQGKTQNDPLIYLVENYVPGNGSGGNPPDDIGFITDNQISNPQFSTVNFVSPYTLSSATSISFEVAPGWILELNLSSGTGTVTLNQVPLNSSATTKNPSNAPYALEINIAGWSSAKLKQRFNQNGMLWANKTVSSAITARIQGVSQNISAILVSSLGTTLGTVLPKTALTSSFNEYTGHANLGNTVNTNIPPNAWIEYQLILPTNADLFLTSFQLIAGDMPLEYEFEQDTIERQTDYLFHYYNPQLKFKPIPSIMKGWDFPVNPAQFGTNKTVSTTPAYAWDQTIMASGNGSVSVTSFPTSGELQVTTTTSNQAFYVMQYISGFQAYEATFSRLSAYINAYQLVHPGVSYTVYLFFSKSAGTIPTLPTTIGSMDSTGVFTLTNSNWIPIPMTNGFSNSFDISGINVYTDQSIPGFDAVSTIYGTSTSPNLCMVVTFFAPTSGTQVILSSIALQQGDIGTRPAPQSFDDVLRECQYFYEKSYGVDILPGAVTTSNALFMPMRSTYGNPTTTSPVINAFATPFTINYKTVKRTVPTITLYSDSGVINAIDILLYYQNTSGTFTTVGGDQLLSSFFSATRAENSTYFTPTSSNILGTISNALVGGTFNSSGIKFHYVADARLGIVA